MDRTSTRTTPRLPAALALAAALALSALAAPACGGGGKQSAPVVAQAPGDGGASGAADGGGSAPDAGPSLGGAGPWPVENRSYGRDDGLDDLPIVAVSTDEAQNLWAASAHALFLLRPGTSRFVKFTSRDGLHLADNPVVYHETYCCPPSPGEEACSAAELDAWTARPVSGAAAPQGISTIVGGAPGEVFVGYWGADEMSGTCADPPEARHSGKLDRVHLGADGKLAVDRLDLASIDHGMQFWHNRTVLRMVYDHRIHPGTLYVGSNHGVDMLLPDRWRVPAPGEWIDVSQKEWMGDHLHVAPCFPDPCPVDHEGPQKIGWWQGLALAPDGDLWHAGRWAAGKIRWVADPLGWENRGGQAAFVEEFGDPYPGDPPVFPATTCDYGPQDACRAVEGLVVSLTAVSAADDGTAWFASGRVFGPGPRLGSDEPQRYFGVASYRRGDGFTYYKYGDLGVPEENVQDLVALPDGHLVLAGGQTGLVFADPATGRHANVRAGGGLPDDRVIQLELDRMVDPTALHVATAGGVAVLRVFPAIR